MSAGEVHHLWTGTGNGLGRRKFHNNCANRGGKNKPCRCGPGTIRGDYGMTTGRNIIHASDSPTSAEREINLFFQKNEVLDYTRIDEVWIYE